MDSISTASSDSTFELLTRSQLQLGLTWPEDQKRLGLAHLADSIVVVTVKGLPVAFGVLFFTSPSLWAVWRRVRGPF